MVINIKRYTADSGLVIYELINKTKIVGARTRFGIIT